MGKQPAAGHPRLLQWLLHPRCCVGRHPGSCGWALLCTPAPLPLPCWPCPAGGHGLIDTSTSVSGMLAVLVKPAEELNGAWHSWDGKIIPW